MLSLSQKFENEEYIPQYVEKEGEMVYAERTALLLCGLLRKARVSEGKDQSPQIRGRQSLYRKDHQVYIPGGRGPAEKPQRAGKKTECAAEAH